MAVSNNQSDEMLSPDNKKFTTKNKLDGIKPINGFNNRDGFIIFSKDKSTGTAHYFKVDPTGLFESTDAITWTPISGGTPTPGTSTDFAIIAPINGKRFFVRSSIALSTANFTADVPDSINNPMANDYIIDYNNVPTTIQINDGSNVIGLWLAQTSGQTQTYRIVGTKPVADVLKDGLIEQGDVQDIHSNTGDNTAPADLDQLLSAFYHEPLCYEDTNHDSATFELVGRGTGASGTYIDVVPIAKPMYNHTVKLWKQNEAQRAVFLTFVNSDRRVYDNNLLAEYIKNMTTDNNQMGLSATGLIADNSGTVRNVCGVGPMGGDIKVWVIDGTDVYDAFLDMNSLIVDDIVVKL